MWTFHLNFTMVGYSILLLILGVLVGLLVTLYLGIHRELAEFAMLFGVGGWPGRVAVFHLLAWLLVLFGVGQPSTDWVTAGIVGMVLLGTVAGPFAINNGPLLSAFATHDAPLTGRSTEFPDDGPVAIAGTVVVDRAPSHDAAAKAESESERPLVSPFKGTPCAAYEWAVKSRQRFTRRTAYTTVDSGQAVSPFQVDTGDGLVHVVPEDPTVLLVFGVGLTGYETTQSTPTISTEDASFTVNNPRLLASEMRYCETTLADGDSVTVIGNVVADEPSTPALAAHHGYQCIINTEFDRINHIVDRYLCWAPHIAIGSVVVGWGYLGIVVAF